MELIYKLLGNCVANEPNWNDNLPKFGQKRIIWCSYRQTSRNWISLNPGEWLILNARWERFVNNILSKYCISIVVYKRWNSVLGAVDYYSHIATGGYSEQHRIMTQPNIINSNDTFNVWHLFNQWERKYLTLRSSSAFCVNLLKPQIDATTIYRRGFILCKMRKFLEEMRRYKKNL